MTRSDLLSRRHALASLAGGAGWLLGGCAGLPGSPDTPARPGPAPLTLDDTARWRLLDRLTWGATAAELARCEAVGPGAWLAAQLAATADVPLPAAAQARLDAMSLSTQPQAERVQAAESLRQRGELGASEEDRKAAREAYQRELNRQAGETAQRQLLRALYSPQQLREQMAWFWFNHFNVHQRKGPIRALLADYEDSALRPHALGSFRTMVGAVVRHPAMLLYLDNAQNGVNRRNENLARELLELHTLGVDGGYTQADVQELARVLTGHGVVPLGGDRVRGAAAGRPPGSYVFEPARHDMGSKQLLGQPIAGRGAEELDAVLDLLVAHPATARRVCTRIAQYLGGTAPSPALLATLQSAFGRTGDIAAVIDVLARSPEFGAAPRAFKDPVRWVVSAVRTLHGERVVANVQPLVAWLDQLGQRPYDRQTPDGWPLTADAWNGSGQMGTRFDIARVLGAGAPVLFRAPGAERPEPPLPLPRLDRTLPAAARGAWSEATRTALAGTAGTAAANALLLSSPEFMTR